jgi:hypothetical protein
MISKSQLRLFSALIILIITPLGFYTKFYSGPSAHWVHEYAGDILYPLFWYFTIILIFAPDKPYLIAGLNLTFDVLCEFSQLLSTPLLERIRANFLGRTIIGQGFDPIDFIYYILGNILAVLIFLILRKLSRR